jgi:hypothetical protein
MCASLTFRNSFCFSITGLAFSVPQVFGGVPLLRSHAFRGLHCPRPGLSGGGSTKKNLFLFLLFLVFAGRASADGIGTNCVGGGGDGAPTPLLTNGQFQAIACNDLTATGFETQIQIAGPAGLDTISIKGPIDTFRAFYLNDQGEVVLSDEATGDRASFVAAYVPPNETPNLTGGPGDTGLPGSTITTDFAMLPLVPGPVLYGLGDGGTNLAPCGFSAVGCSYLTATGITDSGVVEAVETYGYEGGIILTVPVTWNFDPAAPVPEPTTLMLLIPSLLALAAFRLKKATA